MISQKGEKSWGSPTSGEGTDKDDQQELPVQEYEEGDGGAAGRLPHNREAGKHPREEPPITGEQTSRRKDYWKNCRKVQQGKGDATMKPQPPGHQDPAKKMQEGPGAVPGHREGPVDGGVSWPRRDRQNTGKGKGTEEQSGPGERQEGPGGGP